MLFYFHTAEITINVLPSNQSLITWDAYCFLPLLVMEVNNFGSVSDHVVGDVKMAKNAGDFS